MFPRTDFIVTNSNLAAGKVVKVHKGRSDVGSKTKAGKNNSRWDKTSYHRFAPNQASLLMGVLAYNFLHLIRQFYFRGEDLKQSI